MIKTVAIAVITRLLVYATTCIALPVFRWRQSAPKAEFTAPFGIAAAVISLVLIVWLLMQIKFEEQGVPVLVTAVIGLVIFLAVKLLGKRENQDVSDPSL